ncbi:hypothetical protein Tcan_16551 [Toxocara canis]|uniref:Uncharacterized protein n=1 Tax=Toxocara canis TaxID=6265 RepID=A0A0B2VGP3_TOXCA|nr:hypothetical protein Tcan_16551 [Toxocara canis]
MFKNSGLRAAISEPNLKKKASRSSINQSTTSSSGKKSQLVVTATAANLPKRTLSRSFEKAPKNQVSSSEESDQEDQTNFLTSEIIQKLRKYDPSWFKEIAGKHPEYFIDSKQYAFFERIKR